MTTIERAWRAFLAAIAEAKSLHASDGATAAVRDLLQHARELLEIIDEEIAANGLRVSREIRSGLEHLRRQLVV